MHIMKSIEVILAFIFIMLSTALHGQGKFQFMTMDLNWPQGDSIVISIDTSGLANKLRLQINSVFRKFKSETEVFNTMGNLGWDVYLIEDFPNRISPVIGYSGTPVSGNYNLYRDRQHLKRKIYLKMKVK